MSNVSSVRLWSRASMRVFSARFGGVNRVAACQSRSLCSTVFVTEYRTALAQTAPPDRNESQLTHFGEDLCRRDVPHPISSSQLKQRIEECRERVLLTVRAREGVHSTGCCPERYRVQNGSAGVAGCPSNDGAHDRTTPKRHLRRVATQAHLREERSNDHRGANRLATPLDARLNASGRSNGGVTETHSQARSVGSESTADNTMLTRRPKPPQDFHRTVPSSGF